MSASARTTGSGTTNGRPWQVFAVFLRLGLTSFGGPVAHLGYFHDDLVQRRRWLDERAFADLVALCQFLPGPASSQVGIGIGLHRAGLSGALAAWAGFTLPSALLMAGFALGLGLAGDPEQAGWLTGLKAVAVAVVANALWQMAGRLAPDAPRATLAVAAAVGVLLWPGSAGQVAVIAGGGVLGWLLLPAPDEPAESRTLAVPLSRRTGLVLLAVFALLLTGLPLLDRALASTTLTVIDGFYRAGALVFGGGHVILPLLEAEVVPNGLVSPTAFVAGYGAAQAIPGPLTSFTAFLGAAMAPPPMGLWLAAVGLVAAFLPSFLLVLGLLPFWGRLRGIRGMRRALRGVNAAVVGVLLAALYDPVWTSAILGPRDLALALVALLLLRVWAWPAWLVVGACALAGAGLALV